MSNIKISQISNENMISSVQREGNSNDKGSNIKSNNKSPRLNN
jgi:hypothetical protein